MGASRKMLWEKHSWLADVHRSDWLAWLLTRTRHLLHENELVVVGETKPVVLSAVLDQDFAIAGEQIAAGQSLRPDGFVWLLKGFEGEVLVHRAGAELRVICICAFYICK
jgi:hypothetical protein